MGTRGERSVSLSQHELKFGLKRDKVRQKCCPCSLCAQAKNETGEDLGAVEISLIQYLGIFLFGALSVGSITPIIRKFAVKHRIYDSPNSSHKTHTLPVPYLGGVGIIFAVTVISLGGTWSFDSSQVLTIVGVVLPSFLLGVVGLIDDLVSLEPWPRFIAQTAVGVAVSGILTLTNTVGSPTGSRILDILITIFFIVCLSNSINFFDNVDGGASGTVAISSLTLSILAIQAEQFYIAALALLVSGSTVGFLKWNSSPARIYMGDAGSLFLGSILASLLVRFEPNPISFFASFFVPLFLVAIPLLDTAVVVISRLVQGKSPFKGGRDHLSHRLMRCGIGKVSSVFILWVLTLAYCLIAILLSNISFEFEKFIVVFGVVLWTILFAFFFKIPGEDSK
jgi:UDP-GlcNAc:undecaprenyl-phosphate GlcNAc-1-phosphate transferase